MPSVLVQKLDMGLDALVSNNMIDPRGAAQGTENILYEYGIMRTPGGFAKLDLTTGLNSGETVLKIIQYEEYDRTSHLLAMTNSKIYDHNVINKTWDDKTGMALNAYIESPVSALAVAHNDTDIYLDDNTSKSNQYYHLLICDGGRSDIKRWAGKNESTFLPLTGADGYATGGSTHRALQVGLFKTHTLLISPLEWDDSSGIWVKNPQRVRWAAIGKIQTWTGTGSGSVDLLDTGDQNVWSAPLGSTYIVYQNNSIWDLGYVGGTTVFSPRPTIPELGLLTQELLVSKNNVHYFVGNDYNVYAYYGGTIKQSIGDKIHKFLQEDLNPVYENRCRMAMGENNRWLHIFIVPNGSLYITKAYSRNMSTGAWTVRDWSNLFTSGKGITAVNLVGAQTYTTGDSYAQALENISPYAADISSTDTPGDVTMRYGDVLRGDTTANVIDQTWDFSEMDAAAGGLTFDITMGGASSEVTTDFASNPILRVDDGSLGVNMPYGTHYYTVTDVSESGGVKDYRFTVDARGMTDSTALGANDSTGTGIADNSTNVPSTDATFTATFFDPSGATYDSALQESLVSAKLVYGDADGFVYQADEDAVTEDGNDILGHHISPVIDYGSPSKYKRHSKLTYTAKERVDGLGGIKIRFRTGNFDTSSTGWSAIDYSPSYSLGTNCLGRWRMEDDRPTKTVIDNSGNDNTGTAQQNTENISASGKIGKSLSFNGSSDYIDLGSDIIFSTGAWSVALWFKVNDLSGTMNFISSTAPLTNNIQYFGIQDSRLAFWDVSINAGWTKSDTTLQAGQWYHAVLVYDGSGNYQFYLNGSSDSDVYSRGTTDDTGIIRYIGVLAGTASRFFNGSIDTLGVFDKALSSSEIAILYNSGSGTPFLESTTKILTSDWLEYDAYINRSSKRIQFSLESAEGSNFELREAEIYATGEGNR